MDEWGNPTGMERRSFKLNVNYLRTVSIDEDLDVVMRINGMSDGINNRRNVRGYEDEDNDVWLENSIEKKQLRVFGDNLNEIGYEANLNEIEQGANLGYGCDSDTENEVSHLYGMDGTDARICTGSIDSSSTARSSTLLGTLWDEPVTQLPCYNGPN